MDNECTFAPEFNVHECCVAHDYDYADQIGRWKADCNLFTCCWKRNPPVAIIYFIFVRCCGWIIYNQYTNEIYKE